MMRPNILYLHSHDTGRYLQPYGYAVATPNLQRLAEEGVLMRQAFCAAPTCSPSRAALLTGQCAHSAGMLGLAHRGFALTDPSQHLARTLRDAGYFTGLCGLQHVMPPEESAQAQAGYAAVLGTPRNAEQAAAQFLQSAPEEPFFLDVGFFETHRVGVWHHEDGPRGDPRYTRPPAPLPDTPQTRQDMADFAASATILDRKIGTVLQALEHSGRAENTLVLYTTDHGIAFPGMKCNLTDHGIGVACILRWRKRWDGGQVLNSLVSQIDLFPTLCDYLEIAPPPWLQGQSLRPILEGQAEEVNETVFAEVTFHAAYEPMRAVRTRRFKYIRRFDPRSAPVLPNCDDSVSKDLLLAHGWRERAPDHEQLFDLIFDPNEAHNAAADPRYAAALAEMRTRLDDWMRRTNDPLLQERLPIPPKARVNSPDGLSPNEPTQSASRAEGGGERV